MTLVETTAAWERSWQPRWRAVPSRGHIYIVEPMGPFGDDPNVTNKFPGNPTRSYRTRHPLRVVSEIEGLARSFARSVAGTCRTALRGFS